METEEKEILVNEVDGEKKQKKSRKEYMKAYYLAHKEQLKSRAREWAKAHPEKVKEYYLNRKNKKKEVNELKE